MRNEAIGAWEAACLMGTHWTRPRRMADAGLISIRTISGSGGREFSVYSASECDQNYLDYQEQLKSADRHTRGRTAVHLRQDAVRKLSAKGRPQIQFDDAIGVGEAAKILGVYWTRVVRIAEEGKIVGRVLWSQRAGASRLWIFSRQSCVSWAKEVRKLESAGLKRGRPRKSVAQ